MNKLKNLKGRLRPSAAMQGRYADDNVIYSFKDRTIDTENPIEVYRNLNRQGKVYSIRQNGIVVAHTTAICIKDAEFVVNKSGKAKAIKTKERNVHAFVRGFYAMNGMGTTAKRNDLPIKILYNPFSNLGFHHNYCSKNTEIRGARFCIINEEGVKAAYTF